MEVDGYQGSGQAMSGQGMANTSALFLPSSQQPLTSQEARVKWRLEQWRQAQVDRLGFSPERIDYCCRNNVVMHDIFIEAIARSASRIRSRADLEQVAYYWNWIDKYGSEVFEVIRDELYGSKRSRDDYEHAVQHKRIRV